MKKILVTILVIAVIAAGLVFTSHRMGFNPAENISNKDEALTSIEEVAAYIMSQSDTGEVEVYVSGISDEELMYINYYLDTTMVSSKSVTSYTEVSGVTKLVFEIEKSDSGYVYDYLVNGKSIPTDRSTSTELLRIVQSVLSGYITDDMSDYEKELAIHDYIIDHCSYGHASDGSEYTAYGALVNGQAVCSGYAAAMELLMSCCGVENTFVIGNATSQSTNESENHAWNQVYIDGEWYNVDATWDDPVGGYEVVSHRYFNISDELLEETHTWEQSDYHECDSMTANYYMRNGAYFSDNQALENYITCGVQQSVAAGESTVDIECAVTDSVSIDSDSLQFVFELTGVERVSYNLGEGTDYKILYIRING